MFFERLNNLSDLVILLLLLLIGVLTSGISLAINIVNEGIFSDWWEGWFQNFSTEMFGAFLGFWLLGMIVDRRRQKEAKADEPAGESVIPLVCTLTDPELRGRRAEVGKLLASYARVVKELETGYSIAFENGHGKEIVEFIELERECCAFFEFALTFEAGQGPTTLTISGPKDAKEFLRDTMESWKEKSAPPPSPLNQTGFLNK